MVLCGPPGKDAATYDVMMTSVGSEAGGNAQNSAHDRSTNVYRVEFTTDVSGCTYAATLAAVQNGPTLEQPPAGRITVQSGETQRVREDLRRRREAHRGAVSFDRRLLDGRTAPDGYRPAAIAARRDRVFRRSVGQLQRLISPAG